MAIINCPECKREISEKATTCPHCGCPSNEWSEDCRHGDKDLTIVTLQENDYPNDDITTVADKDTSDNENADRIQKVGNKNSSSGCLLIIALLVIVLGIVLFFTVVSPLMRRSDMEKHIKKLYSSDVVVNLPDATVDKVKSKKFTPVSDNSMNTYYVAFTIDISSDSFSALSVEEQQQTAYNLYTSMTDSKPYDKYWYNTTSFWSGALFYSPHKGQLKIVLKSNGEEFEYGFNDLFETTSPISDSFVDVSSSDSDYWYALTAAQNIVKAELSSPSTAKFPASDDAYVVRKNNNQWKVSGFVDSQNSFGALIRSNWSTSFTLGSTSGSQYKVTDYSVSIN